MRLSALRAMGRSADTRWRALARAELSSPDAAMRAEAARACGELEVKAATQEIIDLLEDGSADVRLAAIDALGHLGGKNARDALRLMAAEGDETEAAAAETALEEMLFLSESGGISLLDEEDDDDEGGSDPDGDAWNRSTTRRGG
jgi:HEAT repeat protein